MKKLLLSFLLATSIIFAGCFDTVEEISINENGSGTYVSTMNLGGALEMIEMMSAMKEEGEGKELPDFFRRDIDSTISFRDIMDKSEKEIPAEKRALLQDAKLRIVNNKENKVFKISMQIPFSSFANLGKIIESFEKGNGLGDMLSPVLGEEAAKEEGKTGMPEMSHGKTTVGEGFIQREMNAALIDSLKNSTNMPNFEGQEEMLEAISFTTDIVLPRPVKSVTGKAVKVSADKRRVTIVSNLKTILEDPASLAFRIEY